MEILAKKDEVFVSAMVEEPEIPMGQEDQRPLVDGLASFVAFFWHHSAVALYCVYRWQSCHVRLRSSMQQLHVELSLHSALH